MASTKKALLDMITADSETHIALLRQLIRAPSDNPPGDTQAAIAVAETYLHNAGIETTIIAPKQDSPNLLSRFCGGVACSDGDWSIGLNGHIDQFPVEKGSQWQRDPYSGDHVDGFIHGRSGVDMKAGTAAAIIAFSYLHRLQEHLSGKCVLQVVSDEETGGRWGTRHLLEDAEGEPWRANCFLIGEPSGLDSVRFGEKGTLRLTFTVSGQGGHGAYVHRSEGAIRIASRLISALVQLEDLDVDMDADIKKHMQLPQVRKVADDIMWPGAADAMSKITVNIGTISGGVKINMIPSHCTFEADLRIPVGVATEIVRSHIDKILKNGFPTASYVVHENHSYPSTHSEPVHKMITLLQCNAEIVRGKAPVSISSLGATDCKHFRRHGIPAYAYGPRPQGMAEIDEKVSVDEFLETVKVHTLTAWDYLAGPK